MRKDKRSDAVWGDFLGLRKFFVNITAFLPIIELLAVVISHICAKKNAVYGCLQVYNCIFEANFNKIIQNCGNLPEIVRVDKYKYNN